jgi:hypothetical protein
MNEIWPKLCFHQHQYCGAYLPPITLYRKGHVIWRIFVHDRIAQKPPDLFSTGRGHGGDQHLMLGVVIGNAPNQWRSGDYLSSGYRMQPNHWTAAGELHKTKALADAATIFRFTAATPPQPQEYKRRRQQQYSSVYA